MSISRSIVRPLQESVTRSVIQGAVSDPLQELIQQLFGNGEQGAFYLPQPVVNGQQVLFQDAAGTIPVTADGDPVGLMKDLLADVPLSREGSQTEPTYLDSEKVSFISGSDGLTFDASLAPIFSGSSTWTVWLGLTPSTQTASFPKVFSIRKDGGSGRVSVDLLLLPSEGAVKPSLQRWVDASGSFAELEGTTPLEETGSYTISLDQGVLQLETPSGSVTTSDARVMPDMSNPPVFELGDPFYLGDVDGVIIIDRLLTESEMTKLESIIS